MTAPTVIVTRTNDLSFRSAYCRRTHHHGAAHATPAPVVDEGRPVIDHGRLLAPIAAQLDLAGQSAAAGIVRQAARRTASAPVPLGRRCRPAPPPGIPPRGYIDRQAQARWADPPPDAPSDLLARIVAAETAGQWAEAAELKAQRIAQLAAELEGQR